MNATSELIVSLWFIPVTVFIVIPLLMLVGWTLVKLLSRLAEFSKKSADSMDCRILEPEQNGK